MGPSFDSGCRTFTQTRFAGRAKKRLALLSFLLTLFSVSIANAENLISRPGEHNRYHVEVEPHAYFRYGRGTAFGPGIRFSIPFIHNGPVSSINNNIGITFGADLPFYQGGMALDVPVAAQWNFFFTDVVSVLAEAGVLSTVWVNGDNSGFDVDPIIQGGGRFTFGRVGLLVRVGYPATTIGANFQF